MTPEGEIKAHLKRRVAETGGEFRNLTWNGRRGGPDCFVFWKFPVFAFVEVKTYRGRLSKAQEREIACLGKSGFHVSVVWSKEDVDELISLLTHSLKCI